MRRKRKKKWIEKISSDLWVGNEKKEKEKVSQFQGGFIRAVCSCMARASCLKSILHKCVKKNIFFFFFVLKQVQSLSLMGSRRRAIVFGAGPKWSSQRHRVSAPTLSDRGSAQGTKLRMHYFMLPVCVHGSLLPSGNCTVLHAPRQKCYFS